jgi:glutaredoxin
MRIRLSRCLWLALALNVPAEAAVTVIECVDASGNSSFTDKCPPGTTKKSEKKMLGVGKKDEPSLDEIAAANPITLYSVPDCDACDLVRNLLSTRNLPFTEKDVQDNAEMQEELKAVTGGLTVPATKIGANISTGYSRSAIDNLLQQAGYPDTAE